MKSIGTFSKFLAAIIGTLVGLAIPSFIGGALLMIAWNAIAWEFNLPQFSYWICFCAFYVIRALFSRNTTITKED
jgi:hypothetical protein